MNTSSISLPRKSAVLAAALIIQGFSSISLPVNSYETEMKQVKSNHSILTNGKFSKNKSFLIAGLGVCGSKSWQRAVIKDRWGKANFADDCLRHDQCYETIGKSQEFCDNQFKSGLDKSCNQAYSRKYLELGLRRHCLITTYTYEKAVKKWGSGAYKSAQANGRAKQRSRSKKVRSRRL